MKPIELKIKKEQLNLIVQLLNKSLQRTPRDSTDRFMQSLCKELNIKMSKKNIDKCDAEKPFKVSIKYHQGFVLHAMTSAGMGSPEFGEYEKNLIRMVFNEIDKQL